MAASELDKAVEYTKQFIEAATPIAKQAYEIGLLTLRIDAAQGLVTSLLVLVACFFVLRRISADWAAAKVTAALPENRRSYTNEPGNYLPMMGIPHCAVGLMAIISGVICAFGLVNIWNWTKLFAPELWLAHQAVEKLVR